MKKIFVAALLLLAILGVYKLTHTEEPVQAPAMQEETDPLPIEEPEVQEPVLSWKADLLDVTEGKEVGGINTAGEAAGHAEVFFAEKYELTVSFEKLPEPQGTDFYEGWIVRKGEAFDVISTGRVSLSEEGVYVNDFMSTKDLTDHDFYVLTIEPDDGDPAPAGHVVEGTLVQ